MPEDPIMRHRTIGLVLGFGLFAALLAADAQQMKNVPRIGVLSIGSLPSSPDRKQESSFGQELRNFGWVEGQNITMEYRWASARPSRLADLAAELVGL
jgi:putative tryptophan/tyrosine transport system substrate-binding protein